MNYLFIEDRAREYQEKPEKAQSFPARCHLLSASLLSHLYLCVLRCGTYQLLPQPMNKAQYISIYNV